MQQSQYYLGIMSGTSLDAIDCALVEFNFEKQFKLIHHYSHPLSIKDKEKLFSLTQSQANEINLLAEMDVRLGELIAKSCLITLEQANFTAQQITAIGSHGQTIRHYPQGSFTTSLQIGDANIICERTGITTIADFRRRDMAAGGQGAPLVPPFHAAAFQHTDISRCVVNIGGIANISCLPADKNIAIIGYDSGPGNTLMDLWCKQQLNCQYDKQGNLAIAGNIDIKLLNKMLEDPYFSMGTPKSTGREYFGNNWFKNFDKSLLTIENQQRKLDILATLTELTAYSISSEIKSSLTDCKEILLCGGGVKNNYLVGRLKNHLPDIQVKATDDYGIPAQWIESMAFAWLAKQTYEGKTSNLTSVTGAKHKTILGAMYQK
ncbi:MAG: anhydro-N-acetylmuramic acid kinase [Pseudomonadota bacterium]